MPSPTKEAMTDADVRVARAILGLIGAALACRFRARPGRGPADLPVPGLRRADAAQPPAASRRGRVLPLRAKLALPDGTFGDASTSSGAAPALTLKYRPESGPEVDKTAGIEVRDYGKGNRFVFDEEAHWKFDLGTGQPPGRRQVRRDARLGRREGLPRRSALHARLPPARRQ